MILEQVLEAAAYARPGYSLVSFKEAALPNYLLTTRLLTLEQKALGPIEEACMGAIGAGLGNPDDVSLFLGLPRTVLNGVLAGLQTTECINYSRQTEFVDATVTLTEKGRLTLETLREVVPQESVVKFFFDPYLRKIRIVPTYSLFKPRDVKERGWFEAPLCGAKRPEVEDIPLSDIDKVVQNLSRKDGGTRELLAARRIERRELYFLPCVMLFYRAIEGKEVQVAFYLEEGFSLEHENAFRELGGPNQSGAKHALDVPQLPRLNDLLSGISEKEKVQELLNIEQELMMNAPELDSSIAMLAPTPSTTGELANSAIKRLRSMTQRCIRMHEHPKLLKKALTETKERLLIISPWITHLVIDKEFVMSLEALLRKGVNITIGYGLAAEKGVKSTDKAKQKPAITAQAELELGAIEKRFDNLKIVFLGNTHRKLLVSDCHFAVITSFNWLSFRGDADKKPRDEFGYLVTETADVESIYIDGMELLAKGYDGATTGKPHTAGMPRH